MKISLNWLKRHVDVRETPEQLADILTSVGLEVESIEYRAAEFDGIVVGKVLSCEKHPNADKLSVCTVDTGGETYRVVCGAPNVAEGQTVAFAKEGAYIARGGFRIEARKVRGIESRGMICSAAELGLSDDHSGILVLGDDATPGMHFASYLHRDDVAFELGITPNRGDALSHVGVARDIAAATSRPLMLPGVSTPAACDPEVVDVRIEDAALCPRYSAAVIRNLRVGPSPAWLAAALDSAGVRSINAVVDVTNYVMIELGQPLHAFDLATLAGPRIVVRGSQEGERFMTLDGKEHALPASSILICDAEKPVALGGVMGGRNSEISETTTDILLESACFHPSAVRRTAKKLSIATESGYRFERGTDPDGTLFALRRAVDLILETAGGTFAGMTDIAPIPVSRRIVRLRPGRVSAILGIDIPQDVMVRILESLQYEVRADQGALVCSVPTFRTDVEREIDIIEELARIHGYDRIDVPEKIEVYATGLHDDDAPMSALRKALLALGFDEVVSSSLISKDHARLAAVGNVLDVRNPVSADRPSLRTALLPNILETVDRNLRNGTNDIRIFEIGSVFSALTEGDRPWHTERMSCAMCVTGEAQSRSWHSASRRYDFYDLKGALESLVEKLGLDKSTSFVYDKQLPLSEYGLTVEIQGIYAGNMIAVSKEVLEAFGIEHDVFYAELDATVLGAASVQRHTYEPVNRFPVVKRDLAFILDTSVSARAILDVVHGAGCDYLANAGILDVFTQSIFGEGKKSVALAFTFQAQDRTLTDTEISTETQKIISSLTSAFNAVLRS